MKILILQSMICIVCGLCPMMSANGKDSASAALKGILTDPSEAAIARVTVHLQVLPDGPALQAISDEQGRFTFRGLAPGKYEVSLTADGFEPFRQTNLNVREGETLQLPIQMEILHRSENMTVRAKAPPRESQLETREHNHQEILEVREAMESGAKDVGEALSKLEGTWKIRRGGIANDTVLRGFQQDNINVTVDGVRIYGACPNNMDPSAFHADFAEISQVEVVKGPYSVRDQGSLGGSISLKSPPPMEGFHLFPRLSAGSFNYINPTLVASYGRPRWDGTAGYSFRSSDPYIDGSGKPFTSYANYKDSASGLNAFDIGTFWFKAGGSPATDDRLQLAYTRQQGGRVLYPYLQMDALYDNADRLSASYASPPFSGIVKQFRLESYYSGVRHWMTDELRISSTGASRGYSMGALAATKVVGGRAEAVFSGFTAGIEGYKRNWNTVHTMKMSGMYVNQASVPDVDLWVGGAYAEYRKVLWGNLRLHAGARLDHASDHAHSNALNTSLFWAYNGTRAVSNTNLNPSGNLWVTYSFSKEMEIFVGAGHSVRLPDPQERYFSLKRMGSDWVGNPSLAPTRNNEIDWGINYRGRRFYVRPTLFFSDLQDYITLHNQNKINIVAEVMNPAARSYANVQAQIYGGEVSYSIGIVDDLLLSGGLSYARGIKDFNPSANILDRDLVEMPPLKTRMCLRYGRRRLFGEVEGLAVNAQNHVDSDLKEQRTPGYFTMNLKLGIHFEKMRCTIGVDNLLNRYYYEHFSYQRDPFRSGIRVPEPGRTFYIAWNYRF